MTDVVTGLGAHSESAWLDDDDERPEPLPVTPVQALSPPTFILYKEGDEFGDALETLATWVHKLLVPVYCREVTSAAPWCSEWWRHPEPVALFYGLWMAWQDLTGPGSPMTGPATWHRDFLVPVLATVRDPAGIFAGCKAGMHRAKQPPPVIPFGD